MGRASLTFSRLYVSAADHPCLLSGGRFPAADVTVLPVGPDGVADLAALSAALASHDRSAGLPLVAIHAANNETGVVQPVGAIRDIVRAAGGVLVLDAVQAVGRIPIDMSVPCADYLILSAHKIGGPAGVGAIVAAADLMMPEPLVAGGGQEKGHRAGTENLSGIAGFGAAARAAHAGLGRVGELASMRDRVEDIVLRLAPGTAIHGRASERIANTSFFSLPGVKAETAQIAFDLAGVALSAGSACSSGKVGPSLVLKAMGIEQSEGALRVSVGLSTTWEEIGRVERALEGLLARRAAKAPGMHAA